MKTYDDALNWLNYLCTFGIKEGLERITQLADALDNPQNFYRTICSALEQRIKQLENL